MASELLLHIPRIATKKEMYEVDVKFQDDFRDTRHLKQSHHWKCKWEMTKENDRPDRFAKTSKKCDETTFPNFDKNCGYSSCYKLGVSEMLFCDSMTSNVASCMDDI